MTMVVLAVYIGVATDVNIYLHMAPTETAIYTSKQMPIQKFYCKIVSKCTIFLASV